MDKKQIEKLAKMTKSDKEFRARVEKLRQEEKIRNHKNMINSIKILGIAAGALIIGLVIIGVINNVDFAVAQKADTVKAIVNTAQGKITFELNKSAAPRTVENFLDNVKNGFYDSSYFNRIIKDGIIEGGVPMDGKPVGNEPAKARPGYKSTMDFEITGLKHERWAVAMASTDGKANKTHFYMCLSAQPKLDGKGVVFGKVVDGFDTIEKLTKVGLKAQVLDSEIAKDKDGNPAKSQEHNGVIYEVANDEISRPGLIDEARIKSIEIIE